MARRGFTNKPCHGCGGTVEHKIDAVCRDCHGLMADGRKLRAARTDGEFVEVGEPWFWPAECLRHSIPDGRYKTDWFTDAMIALGRAAAEPSRPSIDRHRDAHDYWAPEPSSYLSSSTERIDGWRRKHYMRPELADAIRAVDAVARECIRAANVAGYEAGSNLLDRLVTGTISTSEFDEKTEVRRG